MSKAHPDEHNARIDVSRVKPRWSDEETLLFARKEAEAVLRGNVKDMNRYLQKLFPDRTLDSVKSKRRPAAYKDLVKGEIAMARRRAQSSAAPIAQPSDAQRNAHSNNLARLRQHIQSLCDKIPEDMGYRGGMLKLIAEAAIRGEEAPVGIADWINSIFPTVGHRGKRSVRRQFAQRNDRRNKKEKRRAEYATVQRLYHSNFSRAAKIVLDGTLDAGNADGGQMERFWRPLFEEPSRPSDSHHVNRSKEYDDSTLNALYDPITSAVVGAHKIERKAAAGPDGITPGAWSDVPCLLVTLLFNILLLNGKPPRSLLNSRTVFIPKKAGAINPTDFRPISIGSVVIRHYHKILASRISKLPIHDVRQTAFLPGDGIAENLYLLQTLVSESRSKLKTLHMASVDVSKAFDTVSHFALTETLSGLGFPAAFVEYVQTIYTSATTTFEFGDGLEYEPVILGRGVKQGDPLSPLLFNLVINRALNDLNQNVGFRLCDNTIGAIAFADDVILFSSTQKGLQDNLSLFGGSLRNLGLEINRQKSCAVSLVASGRDKKMKHIADSLFTIGGLPLPQKHLLDVWTYLGINFTGSRVRNCDRTLVEDLRKITSAPLKPQQRLRVLRSVLLPRHLHVWVLGRCTMGYLKNLDVANRRSVRRWLRLPHDTPTNYFHAAIKDGGLGIPSLQHAIPLIRYKRIMALSKSASPMVRAACNTKFLVERQRWCERVLNNMDGGLLDSRDKLNTYLASLLHNSVDGRGLVDSARCSASSRWVDSDSAGISGRDYINFQKIRANALPCRSRLARGRQHERGCRHGCSKVWSSGRTPETSAHVLQDCPVTKRLRITRHDKVKHHIAHFVRSKGWSVHEEVTLRTPDGVFRPDMIAIRDDRVVVVDTQIVGESISLDDAHERKTAKYKNITSLPVTVVKVYDLSKDINFSFTSVTISNRGIWSGRSANSLGELFDLSLATLSVASIIALRGSHAIWVAFNDK